MTDISNTEGRPGRLGYGIMDDVPRDGGRYSITTADAMYEMREAERIRREVAEEIALALEAFAANDIRGRADMSIDRAAAIAREIGLVPA